jgi:hypothetical protein
MKLKLVAAISALAAIPAKSDIDTIQALTKQVDCLVDKLRPKYIRMIEALEEVDLTSSGGKELCPYFQVLISPASNRSIRDSMHAYVYYEEEPGRRAAAKLLAR